jgi:lipoate-protein ligase A
MQLIVSETYSPSFNLATEEQLLTERHDDVLFFYINAKSVIIFCFVTHKEEKPLNLQWLSLIQAGLDHIGIYTTQGKRKELYLHDKKITGTALHITSERQLYHGKLLYDVQLQNLITTLTPMNNVTGKAVQSVRSNVTNILSQLPSSLTTFEFLSQLISFFAGYYSTQPITLSLSEKEIITQLQKNQYETWKWNWAQSPKSKLIQTVMWEEKSYELEICIERGIIVSLSDNCPMAIQELLLGNPANQLF